MRLPIVDDASPGTRLIQPRAPRASLPGRRSLARQLAGAGRSSVSVIRMCLWGDARYDRSDDLSVAPAILLELREVGVRRAFGFAVAIHAHGLRLNWLSIVVGILAGAFGRL